MRYRDHLEGLCRAINEVSAAFVDAELQKLALVEEYVPSWGLYFAKEGIVLLRRVLDVYFVE